MPSSSRSSSAKFFFGKQPMPCLPRLKHDKHMTNIVNVKRRFGIWFSHKCHFVLHVTKAVQSQHLPMMEATGQTWGGFVQISQHLENTGKSMRTICYIHQMPWAPRPAKFWGQTCAKKIEPLFVTGNLWYLCCKPVCNLYFTNTDRYFETVFRSFLVFSNLLQLSSVKNCLRPWNKASPGPPGTLLFSELCGIPSTGCGIPSTGCDFILCVPFKRAQRLFERDAFTETFNMRELRLKRVVVHFIRKSRIRLCNTLSKGYGIP